MARLDASEHYSLAAIHYRRRHLTTRYIRLRSNLEVVIHFVIRKIVRNSLRHQQMQQAPNEQATQAAS